ncbi:hypothetical protein, partial [Brucella intermedia]|uniref:hypothetical protein n=1 Tax=Brucella intermedia TaxID=94625 RepID=UPI0005B9BF46
MTDLTLDQARGEVAALNERVDAAKAAGAFEQNRAAFEQELRDIFGRTSVAQADGSKPELSVLYSGDLDETSSVSGHQIAVQIAKENPKQVGIIDNTHAGKLAEASEAKAALAKLFGDFNSAEAKAFMYPPRGGPGTPGVFDAMSERFAAAAKGNVVSLSPVANPAKTLSVTEIPTLLQNPNIKSINGLDIELYRTIYKTALGGGKDAAAANAAVASAVNARSADLLNGAAYYREGNTTKLPNLGTLLNKFGINGIVDTLVPPGAQTGILNALN